MSRRISCTSTRTRTRTRCWPIGGTLNGVVMQYAICKSIKFGKSLAIVLSRCFTVPMSSVVEKMRVWPTRTWDIDIFHYSISNHGSSSKLKSNDFRCAQILSIPKGNEIETEKIATTGLQTRFENEKTIIGQESVINMVNVPSK